MSEPIDERPSGLAVAVAGQVAALVVSTLLVAGFLIDHSGSATDEITLKPGVAPVVLSLIPLWVCLIGAVLVAARNRREPVRTMVGLRMRWYDPAYLVVGVALQYAGALLYVPFTVDKDQLEKPAHDLIDRAGSIGVGFWALAAALVLGAPAVEELFYRGLVVGALQRVFVARRLSAALAVGLGALWFAGIHFEWLQFPALALVGVVAAVLFVRTGRVAPGFFLHVGFNAVTVVALGLQLR